MLSNFLRAACSVALSTESPESTTTLRSPLATTTLRSHLATTNLRSHLGTIISLLISQPSEPLVLEPSETQPDPYLPTRPPAGYHLERNLHTSGVRSPLGGVLRSKRCGLMGLCSLIVQRSIVGRADYIRGGRGVGSSSCPHCSVVGSVFAEVHGVLSDAFAACLAFFFRAFRAASILASKACANFLTPSPRRFFRGSQVFSSGP